MKRPTVITAILLIASLSLQAQIVMTGGSRKVFNTTSTAPAYVNSLGWDYVGGQSSFTIPATGAGHNVYVLALSTVTAVSIGSQVATKVSTCLPQNYVHGDPICLWYIPNSVAGVTTVTVTGSSGWTNEFEYSGLSTTSPFDKVGTCGAQPDCSAATGTLNYASELVISVFACGAALSSESITGTNATFAHFQSASGYVYMSSAASVSSSTSVTATSSSCGTSASTSAVGVVWSFHK